jgi:hypothetical protein
MQHFLFLIYMPRWLPFFIRLSLSYKYMAKSKKKSLILRFAQQDYEFLSSRPSSSLALRTLSRPDMQDSQAPSRASTPPRTKMAFTDAVDFSRGARVRAKGRNRGMQSAPPTVHLSISLVSCGRDVDSFASTRTHHFSVDHFVGSGSLGSNPGAENPNPERVGVVAPPPLMKGKAPTGSHKHASPNYPTGTPSTQSPLLVYFSEYNPSAPCDLMESDLGVHKDMWQFCLIGCIAGKFP